jgi:hypothetical protein
MAKWTSPAHLKHHQQPPQDPPSSHRPPDYWQMYLSEVPSRWQSYPAWNHPALA